MDASENSAGMQLSRLQQLALLLAPWTLLALLFTPAALYSARSMTGGGEWPEVLAHYLAVYWIWAAFTPLIAGGLRRWPLAWPVQLSAIAAHLGFALGLILLHAALMAGFNVLWPVSAAPMGYGEQLRRDLVYQAAPGVVLYTATVSCLAAWNAMRRYQRRERSIVTAKLDALRAQLEPHLLFNTLNALSELVYQDAAAADRVLTQLSGFLRTLLDVRAHEHSLADEIRLMQAYVGIQHTLLGERLRVHWQVPGELAHARVPTLLLQPVLENAISHGVAQLRSGGLVALQATHLGERLQLRVDNDGPTLPAATRSGGVGLANTHARLDALYAGQYRLELAPRPGGHLLLIELPLRMAPSA